MQTYSSLDGWEALDNHNYALATDIWLSLLSAAQDAEKLVEYQGGYCAVLIAKQQYQEALALYEELYESTQDCIYLHQMGCLAQMQGNLDAARVHLMAEQACLSHNQYLPLALNAYELGKIALAQAKQSVAFHYAHRSLEYAQKSANKTAEAYAYQLIGQVRQTLKDTEKATDCFEAASEAWEQSPSSPLRESGEARLLALLLQGPPLAQSR